MHISHLQRRPVSSVTSSIRCSARWRPYTANWRSTMCSIRINTLSRNFSQTSKPSRTRSLWVYISFNHDKLFIRVSDKWQMMNKMKLLIPNIFAFQHLRDRFFHLLRYIAFEVTKKFVYRLALCQFEYQGIFLWKYIFME